jgi:TRAP transporter TAXI family solute receptor
LNERLFGLTNGCNRKSNPARGDNDAGGTTERAFLGEQLMTMRNWIWGAAALALAASAGHSLAQQKNTIAIATGGTGGVYYPLGGGLANILTKALGVAATAEVTGGSVDNLKLIGSGQAEIAFTMVDATVDAFKGQDKFKGNRVDVRALAVLYPNRMHVVSVEGKGVEKMADLKGKRVSTGSPGSATEVMAFRVIEAAGLDKDKDMRRERLGVAESVNALKDGKIDAFFWVGGIPTSAVTDLGATPGLKIKMIDHADLVDKMNAKYGNLYAAGTIAAGAYPGQDKENRQTNVWNILIVNAKMPDQLAYDVVKTIFDKKADWVAVHRDAAELTLENQSVSKSAVPFHPGALRYYAERGLKMD